ncbi:MAG: hypothetical protein V1747_02455 [Candidatus Omnitrophota bacterium]
MTVILDRLLEWRDKNALLSKKSMLIGSFFSEIGIGILRAIVIMDTNHTILKNNVNITNKFTKKELKRTLGFAESYKPRLKVEQKEIKLLKNLILPRKAILSDLIQHPILLEHKAFTDLLLATFHLAEELSYRSSVDNLPKKNINHLSLDVERIYKLLLPEWIKYMSNLIDHYPYLFSLYLRLNPFEENIDVTVSC